MIEAARRLVIPAMLLCASSTLVRAQEEQTPLQPYQMVRSLQLLQDRIAAGDHAALPMQNKLLELVDKRFRAAGDEDFAEKRNVRAALVYGMSGGNPKTLLSVLNRPTLSADDRKLGKGVLAYLQGNTKVAQSTLADVDPATLPAELGAFLALVKGSVTTGVDGKAALQQFDMARLLGPGTLVEEAALRRSLSIEASLGESAKFFLAADQYARRFLRSPYASQFADSFVTGILALHASLDFQAIDGVTGLMDADQRKVIYLRLARRAAIEGLTDLSAFASARAETDPGKGREDPRSQLYSSLSSLTSENIETVAEQLRTIDRSQLAESDIRLLEAAEAVVNEVVAKPAIDDVESSSIPAETPPKARAAEVADEFPESVALADPVNAGEPEHAGSMETSDASVDPHPVSSESPDASHGEAISPSASSEPISVVQPDPAETLVTETRAKLTAIDKMLESSR